MAFRHEARRGHTHSGSSGEISLALDDLTDVSATSPAANDLLQWTGSEWATSTVASVTGSLDHGNLSGLSDDDHPQYGHLSQNETVSGSWTFTANPEISGVAPGLYWNATTAGTDQKYWEARVAGQTFTFRTRNDDNDTYDNALRFIRDGVVVDEAWAAASTWGFEWDIPVGWSTTSSSDSFAQFLRFGNASGAYDPSNYGTLEIITDSVDSFSTTTTGAYQASGCRIDKTELTNGESYLIIATGNIRNNKGITGHAYRMTVAGATTVPGILGHFETTESTSRNCPFTMHFVLENCNTATDDIELEVYSATGTGAVTVATGLQIMAINLSDLGSANWESTYSGTDVSTSGLSSGQFRDSAALITATNGNSSDDWLFFSTAEYDLFTGGTSIEERFVIDGTPREVHTDVGMNSTGGNKVCFGWCIVQAMAPGTTIRTQFVKTGSVNYSVINQTISGINITKLADAQNVNSKYYSSEIAYTGETTNATAFSDIYTAQTDGNGYAFAIWQADSLGLTYGGPMRLKGSINGGADALIDNSTNDTQQLDWATNGSLSIVRMSEAGTALTSGQTWEVKFKHDIVGSGFASGASQGYFMLTWIDKTAGGGGSGGQFTAGNATYSTVINGLDTTIASALNVDGAVTLDTTLAVTGVSTFNSEVQFTPQTSPTHTEGLVWYDSTEKALSYYNDEADVTVNMGQEVLYRARNTTGVTIANGAVVYISGATGASLPNISLAQANAESTSEAIGLATHDIENNTNGWVCVTGTVRDLDTSAFSVGNEVYLSPSVAGGLTATRPTSDFVIPIGYVDVANPTIGEIKVTMHSPARRGDLTSKSQDETVTGNWNISGQWDFTSNITVTSGGEALLLADDSGIGSAAQIYLAFDDSAATRLGYVGFGSALNADMYFYNDSGNVRLRGTDVILQDGTGLQIYDASNTDYADFSHDGTDFNTAFTTTTDWNVTGLSAIRFDNFVINPTAATVTVRDGDSFRVADSANTSYINLAHNGTDLLTTFAGTTDWNITGIAEFQLGSDVALYSSQAFDTDGAGDVLILGDPVYNQLRFRTTTAGEIKIVPWTFGTGYVFGAEAWYRHTEADWYFEAGLATPGDFTIYNTGLTDTAVFSHDGTDFNTTFTNTTDWNVTSLTSFKINPTQDANLRIGGTQTGHASTFDIGKGFDSESSIRWLRGAPGAENTDWAITVDLNEHMYLNADPNAGLGQAQHLYIGGDGTDNLFGFMNLTAGGQQSLRFFDSATTADYAELYHDGTDFNIGTVNTTKINVNTAIELTQSLFLVERTGALADVAGQGQIWIRNDAPSELMYTDDTGVDYRVGMIRRDTTTNLASVTAAVNTDSYKVAGAMVYNTTTNKPVWADGSADGDVWVDATGATAHTPV